MFGNRFLSVVFILCIGAGCGGAVSDSRRSAGDEVRDPSTSSRSGDPAAELDLRVEQGYFMGQGAPAPRACTLDSDCVANTVPAEGGCCNDPYSMRATSRAYASWVSSWRAAHCEGVSCPPPPAPSRPDPCWNELSCVDGICQSACPR